MKNLTGFILISAVLAVAPAASAVIINIPADYPTIQEGIDAAQNGDTVLVASGEYEENPVIEDKNILLTSAEGPEVTTIRGAVDILGENVDTTCVLRGFRITKNINDPNYDMRSLVRCRYSAPLILGNIIEDNETWSTGAGIRCWRGPAVIRGNIVRNNFTHDNVGGILAPPEGIVEKNIISGNRAGFRVCEGGHAGGISAGLGVIRYNVIVDNEVVLYGCPSVGGGLSTGGDTSSYIYNNTIVNNSAIAGPSDSQGGGIYLLSTQEYSGQTFKNNIIAFNPYGGGVYAIILDSGYVEWDYNLVFGNGGGDYIGIEPGPHDIQEDPLFVDRFSGDYHLLPNSPCIDAGDPDFPLDPDGSRADIGAYYFDQTVGIDDPDEPSGPYQFQLHQNYPNPFNSQTIISYYLSEESVVSLHIYSITGHFVTAIINKERQNSGEHKYVWDGEDKNDKMVSTGIYFYELYVDDYRESKAMILIK
jgi:hypothetical protein